MSPGGTASPRGESLLQTEGAMGEPCGGISLAELDVVISNARTNIPISRPQLVRQIHETAIVDAGTADAAAVAISD